MFRRRILFLISYILLTTTIVHGQQLGKSDEIKGKMEKVLHVIEWRLIEGAWQTVKIEVPDDYHLIVATIDKIIIHSKDNEGFIGTVYAAPDNVGERKELYNVLKITGGTIDVKTNKCDFGAFKVFSISNTEMVLEDENKIVYLMKKL